MNRWFSIVAALALAGSLCAARGAFAETAQQEKMKTCNADASAKNLKGAERKDFMKTCLSAGGGSELTPQQQKMKTCNQDATAKGLKGAERKEFMKTCLSAG